MTTRLFGILEYKPCVERFLEVFQIFLVDLVNFIFTFYKIWKKFLTRVIIIEANSLYKYANALYPIQPMNVIRTFLNVVKIMRTEFE